MPPFRDLNPTHFHIVGRKEWGAANPRFTGNMWFPLSYVVTSYTHTNTCVSLDVCSKKILNIQRSHMDKCPDIRQNFLISTSGEVYEGRGWLAKPGLPGCYHDMQYTSLYISYIGQFRDSLPNQAMVDSKEEIIKHGIKKNLIREQFLEFNLEGSSLLQNGGIR